jgi:hypothetical protein
VAVVGGDKVKDGQPVNPTLYKEKETEDR